MDMYKSVVFQGEEVLGEVEVFLQQQQQMRDNGGRPVMEELKEIRILYFSPPSERCPPLAVLHTVASSGMCFKMESKQLDSPLRILHDSCARENKTAVMPLGIEELHLVPMYSRNSDRPCFWGFNVAKGLYNSCLVMLNLRCLGIVFDLDETLVVANTMRSFEDRVEALQRKISTEVDPQRIAGMLAEVKRYQDDKIILKQYVENDQVIENGKLIKAQPEIVPSFSDNHLQMVRPIIRFPEKNVILTRINPQIRDTSVLVRLRPAWEDLRSYLIARGRKRFEVYVCTMAERDYAMEMWRLLDPEWNLISSKELLCRIVCVKSGLRKSLFNVFQEGICHPKMALIIDDRLKVWDDQDQPRVHVVPAFAPYYAPQAEANNAIPVLCVARNVACNVRGGFFREFDESLLQRMLEISYEDGVKDIPSPPDVGNYLVSEDDASAVNSNKDPVPLDGMADAEVERRLKEAISAASAISSTANLDPRIAASLQYTIPPSSTTNTISLPVTQQSVAPFQNLHFPPQGPVVKAVGQVMTPEPSFQSSPAREEGEVPESELDPDTRRRLLILQHGQDSRDHMPSGPPFPVLQHGQDSRDHMSSGPPFPVRTPMQVQVPRVQPCSNWFPVEEEMSPRQITRAVAREFPLDTDPVHVERHRSHHSSFFPKVESSIPSDRIFLEDQRPKEAFHRTDRLKLNRSLSAHHSFSGPETPLSHTSCNKDLDFDPERNVPNGETPAGVLHDIAAKCGAKVEFKTHLVASTELQFSIEAWFSGEKIGEGIGKTRREAQWQASEVSIKQLANIYLSRIKLDSESPREDTSMFGNPSENCFVASQRFAKEDAVPLFSTASEQSRVLDPRLEGSKKSMGSVYALKELCKTKGLEVFFQAQPPTNQGQKDEVYAQVEIDGQVLGKGAGLTWDEAKMQASEKALVTLRTMLGQFTPKRQGSPRSLQGMSTKRPRQEFSRGMQRIPSSGRYAKNAAPVP